MSWYIFNAGLPEVIFTLILSTAIKAFVKKDYTDSSPRALRENLAVYVFAVLSSDLSKLTKECLQALQKKILLA